MMERAGSARSLGIVFLVQVIGMERHGIAERITMETPPPFGSRFFTWETRGFFALPLRILPSWSSHLDRKQTGVVRFLFGRRRFLGPSFPQAMSVPPLHLKVANNTPRPTGV